MVLFPMVLLPHMEPRAALVSVGIVPDIAIAWLYIVYIMTAAATLYIITGRNVPWMHISTHQLGVVFSLLEAIGDFNSFIKC